MLKALLAAFTFAATPLAAEQVVWDLASPNDAQTFQVQNLELFAQDVAELSGGSLTISVAPGGEMFDGPEVIPAVERGLISAGEALMSKLSDKGAVFTLDSLPFLATSFDDAARLWQVSRPPIEAALAEDGLTVLYAVPWPGQSILSKNPALHLDDLRGVTMRAYNPATERLAQLLGAVPTEVPLAELPRAFENGRLGAMFTSPSTALTSEAWAYAPHLIDLCAWLPKNVVVANTQAVEALTPDQRAALFEAASRAQTRGWERAQAEDETVEQRLRAHGVSILPPDAEMRATLGTLGIRMRKWWLDNADQSGKAALNAYDAG